ncbi:MAG: porin [Phycisphaerales bacterium]
MSLNKKVGVFAGAASAAFAGMSYAGGVTPSDSDARIAALEQQIAEIKADSGSWLTSNEEQLRALVQDVIADSETRTSLLQNGANAGYDNGFFIANDDGSFYMNIYLQSQFRWVWNSREEAGTGELEDNFGFENRRTKIGFKGNAFGDEFTYKIQGGFDRDGGTFVLEDAWGAYDLGDGWEFQWGQFKAPFTREELISSMHQLAVDRSLVNELVTGDRTQGVMLNYEGDTMRMNFAYTDGWMPSTTGGLAGSNANTSWATPTTEYAITARAEGLLAGNSFKQFDDYTSWSDDEFGWLLGGAVHFQDTRSTGLDTESFLWTIDTQAEFGGSNVAAWVVGAHTDTEGSGANYDQIGWVAQGGFFVQPDQLELFGRYEWYDFDGAASEDASLFTVGFNYYFEGHNWKWTTDFVYALDPVSASAPQIGLLADPGTEDEQMALRCQMQFQF